MSSALSMLGGAGQRLVPLRVPLRFFGSALGFYVASWILIGWGALQDDGLRAGLGPAFAALHALTLGVMLSTVMGASLQILPVATGATAWTGAGPAWLWAAHTGGVIALCAGLATGHPRVLALGAAVTLGAALSFVAVLVRLLVRARHGGVLLAPTATALVSLVLALVMAASLVAAYLGWGVWPRAQALGLHVLFAAWGFMALLIAGFSQVLLPLFCLGDAPAQRSSRGFIGLAWVALLSASVALAVQWSTGLALAAALGLAAIGVHAQGLWHSWQSGLRRKGDAGLFVLVAGWIGVALSLAATGLEAVFPASVAPPVIAALLVGGLVSAVLGVLTRILPFLISMHRGVRRSAPVGVVAQRALRNFALAQGLAWSLVLAAAFGAPAQTLLGAALAGLAACAAFIRFGLLHVLTLRVSAQPRVAAEVLPVKRN